MLISLLRLIDRQLAQGLAALALRNPWLGFRLDWLRWLCCRFRLRFGFGGLAFGLAFEVSFGTIALASVFIVKLFRTQPSATPSLRQTFLLLALLVLLLLLLLLLSLGNQFLDALLGTEHDAHFPTLLNVVVVQLNAKLLLAVKLNRTNHLLPAK